MKNKGFRPAVYYTLDNKRLSNKAGITLIRLTYFWLVFISTACIALIDFRLSANSSSRSTLQERE